MERNTETQYNTILPQAVEHFTENVRSIHNENPSFYNLDPNEWLLMDEENQFEYIMNDDYWVRHWSNFLMKMLVDEIYKEKTNEFRLN
ncbi:MAG: hypothetical protein H6601_06720 [Flavobacteriales bacterium]|nr:hypothetical protein [Flavobacteriales bacterium]